MQTDSEELALNHVSRLHKRLLNFDDQYLPDFSKPNPTGELLTQRVDRRSRTDSCALPIGISVFDARKTAEVKDPLAPYNQGCMTVSSPGDPHPLTWGYLPNDRRNILYAPNKVNRF